MLDDDFSENGFEYCYFVVKYTYGANGKTVTCLPGFR